MNIFGCFQSKVTDGVAVGRGVDRPFARGIEEVKEGEAGDRLVQAVRDVAEVGLLERAVEVVEQGGEGESFFWPELQEILAKGAVPAGLYELQLFDRYQIFPFLENLQEGGMRGLTNLDLRRCRLPEEDVAVLCSKLHLAPNLTFLNLSSVYLGNAWNALNENSLPALTHLVVDGCYDRCQEEIQSLISAFPKMPELKSLSLKHNILRRQAQILADGLQYLPQLEELWLCNLILHDAGVACIAKALHHVPGLRVLALAMVGMDNEGAKVLAAHLKDVPKLVDLDLSTNCYNEEGLQVLKDATRGIETVNLHRWGGGGS